MQRVRLRPYNMVVRAYCQLKEFISPGTPGGVMQHLRIRPRTHRGEKFDFHDRVESIRPGDACGKIIY